MPESVRALIVILFLSIPSLYIVRRWVTPGAMSVEDFNNRAVLWCAVTCGAFLAQNFWLFCIIAAGVCIFRVRRDSNPFAMYVFVLLAIPPFSAYLPGFGGIKNLFEVSYIRILALVVLLPIAFTIKNSDSGKAMRFGSSWIDRFVIAYLVLQATLIYPVTSITDFYRNCFNFYVDIFLPYYVASRSPRSLKHFKEVFACFSVAVLMLLGVAVFEFLRHWLLFTSLGGALGIDFALAGYLARDDSLRAVASAGHSIALGYMCVVALNLWFGVKDRVNGYRNWRNGTIAIVTVMIVALSRGPWVAAAASVVVLWFFNARREKFTKFVMAAVVVSVPVILFTPYGNKILSYLPFIGTVDSGNVDYRQRLVEVSLQVLRRNPWFGSFDYMTDPLMDQMRLGGGFIDMVNTYLVIAMSYGVVGFSLFASAIGFAGFGALRSMLSVGKHLPEYDVGTALVAAMVGAAITIATVSPIAAIPTVLWVLTGLCVAYIQCVKRMAPSHAYPLHSSTRHAGVNAYGH